MARRRSGKRRARWWALPVLIAAIWLCWTDGRLLPPPQIRTAAGERIEVIDGDSLRIAGRVIRLQGFDAPEYRQDCTLGDGRGWPCGRAARDRLAALVASGDLVCNDRGRDRYGRTIARCRNGEGDIGATLVREGLARRLRNARDTRYAAEEDEARSAGRGLWQGAHLHPADWRDARRAAESGTGGGA